MFLPKEWSSNSVKICCQVMTVTVPVRLYVGIKVPLGSDSDTWNMVVSVIYHFVPEFESFKRDLNFKKRSGLT